MVFSEKVVLPTIHRRTRKLKRMEFHVPTMMSGVLLFGLTACTDIYEPKPVITDIKADTVMSTTASLSHLIINSGNTDRKTCTQPQPDAAFDQGESGDIAVSLISLGGDDQSGEEESSAEVEMAGRTPAVLMARELFYRTCEFSQNYKLDKKEALVLYNKTLDSVTQVWATEAGNTTVTVGDTESDASTTGLTDSTTSTLTTSDTKEDSATESDTSDTSDTTSN